MRIIAFAALFFSTITFAQDLPECPKPGPDEEPVYGNEYGQRMTQEEMAANFKTLYENPKKRLKDRAHYDSELKAYVFQKAQTSGYVKIDPLFIKNVTRGIEIALERRYADFVFFPDLGHAHFFFPEKEWKENIKPHLDSNNTRDLYEAMVKERSLKILYHTAEQLVIKEGERSQGNFPQDPILLWRYFTRNVIADNKTGTDVYPLFYFEDTTRYNTLSEIGPDYKKYSAGFYISSSKKGCFPYKKDGKTYYFDISIEEMPYKDTGGGGF